MDLYSNILTYNLIFGFKWIHLDSLSKAVRVLRWGIFSEMMRDGLDWGGSAEHATAREWGEGDLS